MLQSALLGQLGFPVELTTGMPGMAAAVIVGVAMVLALVAVSRSVVLPSHSPVGEPAAVQRRTHRTDFLPQRAPDAAGRPRPRAPSM